MRLFRLLPFLIVPALLAPSASGQARLSFTLGPTFNFLSNVDVVRLLGQPQSLRDVEEYPVRVGYQGGVFLSARRGLLGTRAGLTLYNAGALFDGTSFLNEDSLRVSFVTATVDVQLAQPVGPIEVYVFAGPQLRYLLNLQGARADFEVFRDHLKPLSATADAGGGARLRFGTFYVGPEVRYSLDLTGLSEEGFRLSGGDVEVKDRYRLNKLLLGLVVGRR